MKRQLLQRLLVHCLVSVFAQEHKEIFEHVLYDNLHQAARTVEYYKLVVGQRYIVSGDEHLTIKVLADSYESDPDVFISKTEQYPTNSQNSDWYCEREGSETCIIHNGEFAVGDTLYIGVSCVRECSYKLRAWVTEVTDLTESSRSQMRFDAYSTQILKYYIPSDADGSLTESIEIIISPEDTYVPLDAHLSLDANFYLIEEKPAAHVVNNGIAIKFTQEDYEWCRKCYVYVIVNIYEEMRYYITSVARRDNDPLSESLATEIMVNPFQQECFEYFVLRTKEDVQFSISGYTGHADTYIQPRDVPKGPQSSKIIMRGAHGPSKSMIVKQRDRSDAGYTTGTFNLCFYAYSPYSAYITVLEKDFKNIYDFEDGQILTQTVEAKSFVQGRYTNSELRQRGTLNIHVDVQKGQGLPKIFYGVCQVSLSECTLTSEEAHGGEDSGMTEITDLKVDEDLESHLTGSVAHDPSVCSDVNKCYYIFSVSNKESDEDKTYSMRIEMEFYDPGNVDLEKSYKNVVNHGQFIRHEISPKTNPDMKYLRKLKINLMSLMGDADLFVSYSNPNPHANDYDHASRRTRGLDQVVIENLGGVNYFENTIFLTIYGSCRTQYEITFEYEFQATYNEKLETAKQIGDGQYIYEKLLDEYQEGFYSFSPWWSAPENRTVVFLADVIFNRVFFYSQWNDYPKHFLTTKHDANDTIAYYGGEEHYHHNGGSYYIRLRPDYALYDMLSDREYIYNMYAFSQPPASDGSTNVAGFQTLELGKDYIGYINGTHYQDYRYFQVDIAGVYNITLTRIPLQGKPVFFIKLMDSDNGIIARSEAYHFKSEEHPEKPLYVQNLTLDADMRRSRWSKCGSLLQSLQQDGRQLCFVAVSVTCGTEEDCAYNLRIEQIGVDSSIVHSSRPTETFTPTPPGPILSDEYVDGYVSYNTTRYYQFPVSRVDYGNSLILLNKTQIFGSGANGDSRMLVNLQNNTGVAEGSSYKTWIYPTDKRAGAITATKNNTWPELIEPCEEIMVDLCQEAAGCSFLVGVAGSTRDVRSSYRIKGFRGYNKLHVNKPIVHTVASRRSGFDAYDYYWFVINDTVADPFANFQYQVSVGSETGNDPDLYISVMDGRWPVKEDHDFASDMKGADSIQIASNDTFWVRNGWNTSAGVVVVVGVRQSDPGNYTLVLSSQMQPLRALPIQRIDIGQSVEISLAPSPEETRDHSHLFQLFNWGHKNIQVSLDVTQGSAAFMYNQAGQKHLSTNIFTGVPYDQNNSREFREVNTTYDEQNSIIDIKGDQCFSCWYFIRVRVADPAATTYRLSISENSDSGGPAEIKVGNFAQIHILANFFTNRKFLLDSMDNFVLEALVASGEVEMYVGLDPDTVGPDDHLWGAKSEGGVASLQIKTTDSNFHMATYYYVHLRANDFQDALLNLNLKQQRSVEFIPNNHDSTYSLTHADFNEQLLYEKFQYQSVQESVKFHVFQVPGADTSGAEVFYRVTISIDGLTPHFYPMLYLNRVELAEQPTELSSLSFPTIDNYYVAFGEDPFSQVYSDHFEYTFVNYSTQAYTYYTLAVYQNNWGLTEHRKSEYQIRVEADVVGLCDVVDCEPEETPSPPPSVGNQEEFVLKRLEQPDGSVWKWIDLEAERAAQAAKEAMEEILNDSADIGELLVIIAEEEAAEEYDEEHSDQVTEGATEEEESTEGSDEAAEETAETSADEPVPEEEQSIVTEYFNYFSNLRFPSFDGIFRYFDQ